MKDFNFILNEQAVIDLISNVKNYPGVHQVEFSHIGLASVASAPKVLEDTKYILDFKILYKVFERGDNKNLF